MSRLTSLKALAVSCGIQLSYRDIKGRRLVASEEALAAALQAMGILFDRTTRHIRETLEERRRQERGRPMEPVVVLWDGGSLRVPVRFSPDMAGRIRCVLDLEDGGRRVWFERCAGAAAFLRLPRELPWGYHRLTLETKAGLLTTCLLKAPRTAYGGVPSSRQWGLFVPLYALHSKHSWGCGDFSDLKRLSGWAIEKGAAAVATLPLLASFLDKPFEPSPYAPASRLFWNEFYLDVERIPELKRCAPARQLIGSGEFQEMLERLRRSHQAEYLLQMRLKRRVLELLAQELFKERAGARFGSFRKFVERNPDAADYASFRAAGEKAGQPWPLWPQPQQNGILQPADWDEEARRYHLYVQWIAQQQIDELRRPAGGIGLYLDLPLGVHPDSYDVWRYRSLFALQASVGAPPDSFFMKGQDWGFPPILPEQSRREEHRYFRKVIRFHCRHAGLLRIDHVMGLHRLFWVPRGLTAKEGVYVRYPAQELYAILQIESHRAGTRIVGENLGTVPPEVNAALHAHRLRQMYVVQYEVSPSGLRAVPADSVASMNTHDMFPFAAYWRGTDIAQRRSCGLLKRGEEKREKRRRALARKILARFLRLPRRDGEEPDVSTALTGCLEYLSASPAEMVLLNLEDLWEETEPQNLPGTWMGRGNWRRKARLSLEEIRRSAPILDILRKVGYLRKKSARRS
ncbi:MAG: 4-alpha-glucanotransferase [Candidatus Omnitrophica bacterium]|nr:4-alpha-glucanotransferase [Candidatus Omnitrophota bacterium]